MIQKSNGFAWPVLIPYVALIASIGFGLWFLVNGIYEKGEKAERAKWELSQAKLAKAATETVLELKADKHELEKKLQEYSANLTAQLNRKVRENDHEANRIINSLERGDIKLRLQASSAISTGCADGSSRATASIDGDHATTATRFSREDAGFLIEESRRANEIVLQLTACQAQLAIDRKVKPKSFFIINTQSTGELK